MLIVTKTVDKGHGVVQGPWGELMSVLGFILYF